MPEGTDRPKLFDGYVRVSDVGRRSGPSFISPSVQREQIESWARLRGVEVARIHEDLDRSGGTASRPGLTRMLGRARKGKIDGIVVPRLDRLTRGPVGEALKLVEEINSM